MTNAHTAAAALGEARALIARLGQVVEDRMTTAGHPAALVTAEHLGTCRYDECSARCRDYRALVVAADRWLKVNAEPEQLTLLEATG